MRMKMVCDDRTLQEVANEFLALKKAQKVRERTLSDYKKYIDKFLAQSQNTLDVDVLKIEILEYFADIPKTSPARFNHPYQYLHALFEWCAKQDYLPYNPFQKLQLKKVRDEGNVQPAEIKDIQTLLKALDKHNYTELRDYNIVLLILDTGIRTSELMAIKNEDYDPEAMSIVIRPDVAKTSRSRTLYLSAMTNTSLKKFLKSHPETTENRMRLSGTGRDQHTQLPQVVCYGDLQQKRSRHRVGSKTAATQFRLHHAEIHRYRAGEDRNRNPEPRTVVIKDREPYMAPCNYFNSKSATLAPSVRSTSSSRTRVLIKTEIYWRSALASSKRSVKSGLLFTILCRII